MNPALWAVALLLGGAAVAVAWPVRTSRARRRKVLGTGVAGADRAGEAARHGTPSTPGREARDRTGGGHRAGHGSVLSIGAGQAGDVGVWESTGPATPRPPVSTGTPVPPGHLVDRRAHGPWRSAGRPPTGGPPGRRDPRRPEGGPDRSGGRSIRGSASFGAGRPSRLTPGRVTLLTVLAGATVGALLGGPVATVAVAGYGAFGVRSVRRRRAVRHAALARRRRLDQLCALAADLRAGLPVPVAAEGITDAAVTGPEVRPARPGGADRLAQLARAAVRLADRTGAPLAELVERIEADARATDRGLAAAAAQAAGARATALLLAVLPLGGIGLGYGIGVDPVAVLLHTPVGGGCAVAAIVLQVAGLLWAERLGAAPAGES
ncbi:tight adherence protein B [Micromonospora mirobrigensis]|uniref:Tight adherence protein B n=1 Tax=Micromonospora mirobrigensis TaxID=262898 RepID=A0A1C4VBZ5_9ACTN|nr:tight adherence protein B [Micromonospora mirobrigensis]